MQRDEPLNERSEARVPVSESSIWDQMRELYTEEGTTLWNDIPHHVTSSPFHARQIARLLYTYINELAASGQLDASEPVYMLDIGAGIGRFDVFMLRELLRLHREEAPLGHDFVLVMTDLSPDNIANWRAHPQLQPFVEMGWLDFATLALGVDTEIHLVHREQSIAALANPAVVLGNYLFCSLPQDYFRIEEGQLQVGTLPQELSLTQLPTGHDCLTFAQLGVPLTYEPISLPYYGDERLDSCLQMWLDSFDNGIFLFPKLTVEGLLQLQASLSSKLMVLVNDKGFATDRELYAANEQGLAMHGQAFSIPVDFSVLGHMASQTGGGMLHQTFENPFTTAILGVGEGSSLAALPQTHRVATAMLEETTAGDTNRLFNEVMIMRHHFSLEALVALMKVNLWDPAYLSMLLDAILAKLHNSDLRAISKLIRAFPLLEENDFPYPGGPDCLEQQGIILMTLGRMDDACEHFQRATEKRPGSAGAHYQLGRLHHKMMRLAPAKEAYKAVLALDPTHQDAKRFLEAVEQMMR